MEISIKWNICRVCLQEEKKTSRNGDSGSSIKFVHLFDENKKLANQILELSGVAMKPGDFLPEKICSKCVTIVDNAIKLCRTCRSSNTYLQSILERTRSASNLLKSEMSVSKSHNDDDCMEDSKIEDNADVPNENVTICNKKRRHESLTNQTINSLSDQEQLAVNVNISDYIVEEIIVMSDEDEVATGNNSDAKTEDITENRKPSPADCSHTYEDLKEDQVSVSEKFVEFVNVDHEENNDCNIFETVMVGAEEQIIGNEDQAQVSSTVDTKEEFDYYEDNSNISNFSDDLDKKSAINEDTSNCSISSTKHAETPKKSHSHNDKVLLKLTPIEERKSPIVFSKRKMKRNRFKSAAYEPVQVCVCEICGNRFTNQNKMKLHMKIHLQHKNHQCELCFKRFITACNLQAHMRIHTGEKPYECKYCSRRFNDRSSHLRHERTHTNEKPFECFNCGKCFSLATTLQNHMKVHSNERSHRCEPCGKSFKLAHHLKKHQSTTLHRSVLQIGDDEA